MNNATILAGDVGATKTNLALIPAGGDPRAPVREATFPSAAFDSLEALLAAFLADGGSAPSRAALGVPGPVVGGRVKVTNLPWVVDGGRLAAALDLSEVVLLNDLEAIAAAVPDLTPGDLHTLHPGTPEARGALAVIAPGTGLGQAFLTWDGRRHRAHPSEGGHAEFAPRNAREAALLSALWAEHGHVSVERVCSGSGLPRLHRQLKAGGEAVESPEVARKLAAAADPTPVIVDAALSGACPLCRAALAWFVSILGAEAGNLALKVKATGGVYLGGGIPPRILPALGDGTFLQAFVDKGRFRALMSRIPVRVILDPKAALWGAAAVLRAGEAA